MFKKPGMWCRIGASLGARSREVAIMAKVFGIHALELHPGVTGEDFEQFFREQV